MQKFIAHGVTLIALVAVSAAVAQDAPRKVQQVTLSPPKEASIRQKSGPARVFTLISLTEEVVTIRTSAGKEVEIEMDKIKTIRTRDGEFDYSPEDEAFASLLRRANRISGVSIETVDVFDPLERFAPGEEIPQSPGRPDPDPAVVRNTPPPDTGMPEPVTSQPLVISTPEVTATPAPVMQPDDTDDPPAPPGTTIYTCATCGKELPAGVRDGDKCPHCGIVFWNRATPAAVATANSDGSTTTGYPEAAGNPTTSGAPANNAAPATAAPSSSSVNFDEIPMWMKVGFFVGLLAIGWLLLQRR